MYISQKTFLTKAGLTTRYTTLNIWNPSPPIFTLKIGADEFLESIFPKKFNPQINLPTKNGGIFFQH